MAVIFIVIINVILAFIIEPFGSFFTEYPVGMILEGAFLLILLMQVNRSVFVKITIDEEGINYKSLLKNYTITYQDLSGIYICWHKPVKGSRLGSTTVETTKFINMRDLNRIDFSPNPTIILTTDKKVIHKIREFEYSKYKMLPATENYITFEYRQDLNDSIKKLLKFSRS